MDSSTPAPVRVAIVGATGYTGIELIRLLHNHPGVQLTVLGSRSAAGKRVCEVFPHVDMVTGQMRFAEFSLAEHADAADVFFLAMDNGRAMELAPALLAKGRKIIDLSADYRLRDPEAYPVWYKFEHTSKDILAEAVYGLPEVYGPQIRAARVVANPGCYTTTSILALAPAMACKAVDPCNIIVDAYSGVSGAGRSKKSVDYLFTEVNDNAKAYAIGTHRHTPEIEQELSAVCGCDVRITFTPHLAPMTRGILATCYAALQTNETLPALHDFYEQFYADAPFVDVLPLGQFPSTQHVRGTNMCRMGLAMDPRTKRLIVVSATDNLIKGAAGQAVQNLNIVIGYPETTNLPQIALYP
ncbi:MAG TPA: N-acetyl-gamma-glutamyl-phosphate reductase [Armatimonadota bacterium]|jgi:N-acetyl-gamma-glutamyl-phosphate reductase